MRDASLAQLAKLFRILSNPVRLEMLRRLAKAPLQWSVLVQDLGCSRQAAARHIQLLKAVGLIGATGQPEYHIYRLQPAQLAAVDSWLHRYRRIFRPISPIIADDPAALDFWETG